ncbi:MAG: endopeptidase La [Cardiobacteriaceae bacterium]|nr:endopeptidase La [Cardiobacteriaceae bacterium]
MNIEYTDRVKILETLDHLERIELVCNLLDHEQNKLELDNKIKKRVKEQMDKNQREYYLREKIKAVNKELHELEGVENEFDKYAEKIREAKMPKEAEEKAKYELGRLEQMSPSSSDANVCRNYLDWLISYPWSKEDSQQCDLREAEKIFDADHFGLEEVKDRILDYLAVYRRQTEIINRKKAEADWKKAEEAEKNQETQTDSNTHQPQTKIDIIKTDQNIAAQEAISNEKLAYEEEKIALEKAENTADKQEAEEEINQFKSPIICLMGPPGVGKTSLGKSIAKAMGRKFVRIALGGVDDESEIRGHRRTYVAAMPGKIVQKLCKVGTKNPVILLDEIDKIDRTHRGDPAAALLEVLDPAQNNAFNDHYLDLDVDLSQVFFIATANTFNIPTELVDRMEVIRISGYTPSEKREIAKRYLLPRQLEENALKAEEISFSNDLIDEIIEKYTRESGVRNLEREIGKIARKAVRKLETSDDKAIFVDKENLKDFLGTEKFVRSDDDLQPKIGSVTGLAWTSVGGELLQIETAVFSGKGNLNHTGQLGDVMKESIQAALSVVRQTLDKADPDFDFSKYDIHIHLPEGATPKDGPSAGIAMATALLSTLTQKTVRGDIAMTGEITLNGRVLAIGGLKEKLLAAQRGKIKTVLIPKENIKDLRDIPEEVKNELEIIAVEHISEVFSRAFNEPIEPIKAIPVSTTTAISGKMEC